MIDIIGDGQYNKALVGSLCVSPNISYSTDFFDYVTAVQIHYFWANLKNDAQEGYRILKKKGIFIIVAELYKTNYHVAQYGTVK